MLGDLPVDADGPVLVDYRTGDDAGVYKLSDERALVQTVDFFTPIVDDPFVYGQIAAANSLSDIYAMGGRPLTALAVAGFPKEIDRETIKAIFSGGLAMLRDAGVALLGGHTVQDPEVKFGYAVTGDVRPDRMWTNAGARAGDELLLTKPLGTGTVATAIKFERAPADLAAAAIRSMTTLNRAAAEVLHVDGHAVHACTDVTGFGLLGHASAMAQASGVSLQIESADVPLIEGVLAIAVANVPGGGRTNAEHFAKAIRIGTNVRPEIVHLLYDPQTSGGLLVAIDGGAAESAMARLVGAGCGVWRIGRVTADQGAKVVVR